MGESPEPGDNVPVFDRHVVAAPPKATLRAVVLGEGCEEGDAFVLQGEIFCVHEREKEEETMGGAWEGFCVAAIDGQGRKGHGEGVT